MTIVARICAVMPIAKGVGDKFSTQKLYRSDDNNPGSHSFSKERAVGRLQKSNNKGKRRYTIEEEHKNLDSQAYKRTRSGRN